MLYQASVKLTGLFLAAVFIGSFLMIMCLVRWQMNTMLIGVMVTMVFINGHFMIMRSIDPVGRRFVYDPKVT
ncbi:MAG: hypothetical protein RIG62_05240 [Cyclobacteriaceae bacterium]